MKNIKWYNLILYFTVVMLVITFILPVCYNKIGVENVY